MYKLLTALLVFSLLMAGCKDEFKDDHLSDLEWFDSKEEALDHHTSPSHELTLIQTINDEEIILASLNGHTFYMAEIVERNKKHAVAQITASYSLNNTVGGEIGFSSLNKHSYNIKFSKDQEQNHLPASSSEKFYFHITTEQKHSDDVTVILNGIESVETFSN
ncbi:hypothetical protein E3U55_06625 [Filobacillus milosensis]|uniref:Lipoprotein n=1 Tax=Filobacillus milosensis TaxID=94137 RepID=A0A4Y8INK5_9BACI|nr:hypothetical protein [Filobacillus milosensis]TFB22909.1 hypothetical protein E3U55_06625 [Filobacillus milosensis]